MSNPDSRKPIHPPASPDLFRATTRREFLGQAAAYAGVTVISAGLLPATETPRVRTAVDQVPLGKTGLRIERKPPDL